MQAVKRNILSWVLLLLVFLNIGSTTLFIHKHNIEGRTITHSHPFSGTPESHSHSLSQFDIISRLARVDMVMSESVSIDDCDYSIEYILGVDATSGLYSCSLVSLQLRAPPVA